MTIKNYSKPALRIIKIDQKSGERLPGVTFEIYVSKDKTEHGTYQKLDSTFYYTDADGIIHLNNLRYLGGTSGTGGTVIGQKVTGKNGAAIWTGLKPGAYVVEEVNPAEGYSIIKSSETVYLADSGEQSVITVRFDNAPDGYVLDSTPQSIEIKSGETQSLTFYNTPIGGLELIKVFKADKTQRIRGVTFEIRKMDGRLVDTITTGDNGRVYLPLDAGDYYSVSCLKEEYF